MMMSRNIHLYHLRGNEQSMISMGLIGFKEGDTLLSLRQKLEGIRIFESAFQFWDSRLGSPVHMKLEALIFVEDLEGKVVLFETKDSEESNLVLVGPRVEIELPDIGTQPVERNVIYNEQNEEIVDVLIGSSEPSVTGDDRLEGEKKTLEPEVNHRAETDAACAIVEKVNGEELSQKKPFVVEGDVKRESCYSWIFKDSNFEEVAKILTAAKALHGITGDIAEILAEDETRVKPIVRWEARRDTLIGFCGDKDNHVCKMGLEVEVGSGESCYSKIVESFEQKIQGSYARVVIVNPLHEKLPSLIVYASVTCNLFTASWVRDHWKGLKQRWDKCCRQVVGPVLDHANDGDARRRKLMLEDYLGSEGQRWTVAWDGWVLSGIVLDSGDVYALGDPIQNGKKMINPLDKSSYPIVLGDFHACLEHVQLVYKLYSHDHYGLNIDDVMRRDR
ncbi:hypothetical protein R1flu_011648 [Riccia fluitans]|uniref:Uncharacterized protein n=1 Tax=Riccia fluitans TaxID=41844 RepID=A0ABD1Z8E2_9MARC